MKIVKTKENYNTFILTLSENIEFEAEEGNYGEINGNIINYLNKNGTEFIKSLDFREKENIWNIEIRDFFV